MLPVIALQFCRNTDFRKTSENDSSALVRRQFAKQFLTHFRGSWEPSRHAWKSSVDRWMGPTRHSNATSPPEDLVFQYHMRVFTTQTTLQRPGAGIFRAQGQLPVPYDVRNLDILEIRYSVGMKTTLKSDLPIFSLVTLVDKSTASSLQDLGQLGDIKKWTASNIHPSKGATGVAAFAFRIHSLLPVWEAKWSALLMEIDRVLQVDVSSTRVL